MMSKALIWTFFSLSTIEGIFICIGNAFTVFVFWHQRASLKRAWSLLLNLGVADFLVGATLLIDATIRLIAMNQMNRAIFAADLCETFLILFMTASLLTLLVISLERAYAILWPFRHRVATTRAYITCIALVWAGGFCTMAAEVCAVYEKISWKDSALVVSSAVFTSLSVILGSYLTIRKRLKTPNPSLEAQKKMFIQQNVKLSKTMFAVIALSFAFWLPPIFAYPIAMFYDVNYGSDVIESFAIILSSANSLVNPIVYSYKMPAFKAAVITLSRKIGGNKRRRPIICESNIEMNTRTFRK